MLKAVVILISSLFITGSSNYYNVIGFWQVIHTKANPLQIYWQFPRYFKKHIDKLPNNVVALLARGAIPTAQLHHALNLLATGEEQTAQRYWQKSLPKLSSKERIKLAKQLLLYKQWEDLHYLAAANYIEQPQILNQLYLKQGVDHHKLSENFLQRLGFLSLNSNIQPSNRCMYNVLMMSDHRKGLYKLAKLVTSYNIKPEPSSNIFCFTDPVYVSGEISCATLKTSAATCNWQAATLDKALLARFDFIIMMPKNGSANVHRNIMQLSSDANYNVFLHELMHFSGFEDEYPLPRAKQAWLCQMSGLVAPNLFIVQKGELAPKGWYKSKSCQEGGTAYKPSKDWSILEYQQLGLSEQYRALWFSHISALHNAKVN